VLVTSGGASESWLAELLGSLEAGGAAKVTRVPVPAIPEGPGVDPFRLRERIADHPADAWILVANRRWGPRRVVPGPVVEGRPVGILQELDLGAAPRPRPTPDPRAPWVVSAMAKGVFLRPTEHWASTLNRSGPRAVDLRADRARRSDLLAALQAGPSVVLYAGHGRTRGWGGYQTVRWRHLEPPRLPEAHGVGAVIAFACDTLTRSRSRIPFGSRLVGSGFARAYLGAASPIRTADAEVLAEVVVELLAGVPHRSLAGLMTAVDREVASSPPARRAWRRFRLVGDPTTPVLPPTDIHDA